MARALPHVTQVRFAAVHAAFLTGVRERTGLSLGAIVRHCVEREMEARAQLAGLAAEDVDELLDLAEEGATQPELVAAMVAAWPEPEDDAP